MSRQGNARRRAGIREVATAAGVSITTVSDTLNGKGRISEATRQRVREAADALGYRPSVYAQGLRGGRSRLLGLVVTKFGFTPWQFTQFPYYSHIIDAAVSAAVQRSYAMVVLPTGGGLDQLLAVPFDGVFVVDPLRDDEVVARFRRRGVPVIADRANSAPDDHLWVDIDHDRAVTLMCDHLVSQGARNPALVASIGDDGYSHGCIEAYSRWCARNNTRPTAVRVSTNDTEAAGAIRALLTSPCPPDAVFGIEDQHLPLLQSQARAAGLHAPRDIALGCFAEEPAEPDDQMQVTTLTTNPTEFATRAITLLLNEIESQPPRQTGRLIDCALVARTWL
ncbi:LacI family DNA-binding transcriptional regulator [Pseudonocardia spinosispora]|uniref:LacI family DNA-binding transcriptional regulator n=1 Tax=Pseudonocardia spinosispora TaxID=103441 RepID=UPI0003F844AB|nr:LacI family DNA-binding transcriptional regulator [Pseudonocardia spinosispora]